MVTKSNQDLQTLTEAAEGLSTSVDSLQKQFVLYRKEQARLRIRDLVVAAAVVVSLIAAAVIGLVVVNTSKFDQACKNNSTAAASTIQFYNTIKKQTETGLAQLRLADPKTEIITGYTVGDSIKASETQLAAIEVSIQQLEKVQKSC